MIDYYSSDVSFPSNVGSGLMVGGGFIRDSILFEKPNDIDMFGHSIDFLGSIAKKIKNERKCQLISTQNAITLIGRNERTTLQFITRWLYNNPQSLIHEFDFTIAQAVVFVATGEDGNKVWDSCCAPLFYTDLASHRLRYTYPDRTEDAGGSILRVCKFLKRGYSISPEDLSGVIARLVRNVDTSRDDVKIAGTLNSLMREVDPTFHRVDGLEVQPDVDELERELGDG